MPTFEKDGKKRFHMNPQAAKAMGHGDSAEESTEEKISPGIHEKVSEKLDKYDGHDHEGHQLQSHVEIHHGGNPGGEPAMHEGTSHHTISHPHPSQGSEPSIQNHDSHEEALNHVKGAMHMECPNCGHEMEAESPMEDRGESGSDEEDGY